MNVLDAIGLTGPPFEVLVERGKIMELARASGSAHPAYLEDPNPVSPPAFLATVGFLWGHTFEYPGDTPFADVELDRSLLLHGGEECEFFGPPPRAGTRLMAQIRISDVQVKQGRRGGKLTFITTETRFQDESDQLVAIGRTTFVHAGEAPGDD